MKTMFELQRHAFLAEGSVSAETRIDRMRRLAKMVAGHQHEIIEACQQDFDNRSRHQSRMSEVLAVLQGLGTRAPT